MCGVAGFTHNRGGFPGEAGGVSVLQGREWGTNDLTSCVYYPLQFFPAVCSAATAPHSDAAGQDAFNGALVECFQDGCGSSRSLEFAEEVEASLGFLPSPVMQSWWPRRGPR